MFKLKVHFSEQKTFLSHWHDAAEQDPLAGEEALAITCEIPAKNSTFRYKASMFKLKMHFSKERIRRE
jgi:hypothetical protein